MFCTLKSLFWRWTNNSSKKIKLVGQIYILHMRELCTYLTMLGIFHRHPPLNHKVFWGTTDDFTTSSLHFCLFSTALWDLVNLGLSHSPMLSLLVSALFPPPPSLCFARWFWPDLMNGRHVHATSACISLQWSGCLHVVWLHAGSWHRLPHGNMVLVWDAWYLVVAPHLQVFYSSLQLCCEGPWFTSIQEDGCDKGAPQVYLGAKRNASVIPNWFPPYQCCCCVRYPGEYLGLGTLISYNWAQLLGACDCLKLLSMYFNLCVDATGVVCHQLGSKCLRLCRLCWDSQLILPVFLPVLLSHQCLQQSGDWWLFCPQCWQCFHDFLRRLSWSFPEICWRGWVRVDIPVSLQLLFGTSLQCCHWRGLHWWPYQRGVSWLGQGWHWCCTSSWLPTKLHAKPCCRLSQICEDMVEVLLVLEVFFTEDS